MLAGKGQTTSTRKYLYVGWEMKGRSQRKEENNKKTINKTKGVDQLMAYEEEAGRENPGQNNKDWRA